MNIGGEKMYREEFPILNNDIIYFDSGATALKPKCVVEAVSDYYLNYSANVHRGDYDMSLKVDEMYEGTREKVREFLNAPKRENIVFTYGATDSINKAVFGFFNYELKKDDEVLIYAEDEIEGWEKAALEKSKNVTVLSFNPACRCSAMRKPVSRR